MEAGTRGILYAAFLMNCDWALAGRKTLYAGMAMKAAILIDPTIALSTRLVRVRGLVHVIVMAKMPGGGACLVSTINASRRPGQLERQREDHEQKYEAT